MADKAYITPKVLIWGRESAKMSVEIAAAKVLVAVEKLVEWEAGVSQPTIRQADASHTCSEIIFKLSPEFP